jgi:hypothetical protein
MNVVYLYAELEDPMLNISVKWKRNAVSHQHTIWWVVGWYQKAKLSLRI